MYNGEQTTEDFADSIDNWSFNYGDVIKLQQQEITPPGQSSTSANKVSMSNYNGIVVNSNGDSVFLSRERPNFVHEPYYFKIEKSGLVPWTPVTTLNNLNQISSENQYIATVSGDTLSDSNVTITLGSGSQAETFSGQTNQNGNFSIPISSNYAINSSTKLEVWAYDPITGQGTIPIISHFYAKGNLAKSGIFVESGSSKFGAIYFNPITKKVVYNLNFLNQANYAPNFTTSSNTSWFNSGIKYTNDTDNSDIVGKQLIPWTTNKYSSLFFMSFSILSPDKKTILHQINIFFNKTEIKNIVNIVNQWSFNYGDIVSVMVNNYAFIGIPTQINGLNNYSKPFWPSLSIGDTPLAYFNFEASIEPNGLEGNGLYYNAMNWVNNPGPVSTNFWNGPEAGVIPGGINGQGWVPWNWKIFWNFENSWKGYTSTASIDKTKFIAKQDLAFTINKDIYPNPKYWFAINQNFIDTVAKLKKEAPDIPGESRDWDIAKYFQQWVSDNMHYKEGAVVVNGKNLETEYDGVWKEANTVVDQGSNYYTLMDIFKYRIGVCYDYAILYAAMCAQAGIVAASISGNVNSPYLKFDNQDAAHVYDMVYIPEKKSWIFADPTWDFFNGKNYIQNTRNNMFLATIVWNTAHHYLSYFTSNPIMASYRLGIYWNQNILYKISIMTPAQIEEQLKEMNSI